MQSTKKLLVVLIFIITNNIAGMAQRPNWGIGLRVGDPLGITVKRYIQQDKAWEFNLGRSGFYGYNYQKAFRRYDRFDGYEYRSHYLNSALSIQLHYLIHKDLRLAEAPGLDWYYGVGGQLRSYNVNYEYQVRRGNGWEVDRDRITDIDLGVDGIIGLEYSWREVPLTVFADVNLFVEIIDAPFFLYLQGGAGVRYYF